MFNLKLLERVGYTSLPPTKFPNASSPALRLKLFPWRSTMTSNYSMQCTVFCLQIQLALHVQSSLDGRNLRKNIGSVVGWTCGWGNCRNGGLSPCKSLEHSRHACLVGGGGGGGEGGIPEPMPLVCRRVITPYTLSNTLTTNFCLLTASNIFTDISPSNLDSSLCFIQPSISHDVLCI